MPGCTRTPAKLADRDPLTGFYNHRFLHERLGEEVVRAQRARRPLSVLMLDLDDFKLVNDTFGHLFGDRVLTWTAELIRSTLRASDIPARYGGDELSGPRRARRGRPRTAAGRREPRTPRVLADGSSSSTTPTDAPWSIVTSSPTRASDAGGRVRTCGARFGFAGGSELIPASRSATFGSTGSDAAMSIGDAA